MGVKALGFFLAVVALAGCATTEPATVVEDHSFGGDVAFLRKHTQVVLLTDRSSDAQVAVVPSMQGRIMTSTADGRRGLSFGWINRELIASGETLEHMNPYGGEDRFWLGPEGGQFSIFFEKGAPFDLENWQTPAPLDTEPFKLISKTVDSATFRRMMKLRNYFGTEFDVQVDREVCMLNREQALKELGVPVGSSVKMVAFESNNRITNAGDERWRKPTGLLSIWILGMFNPSPETTVVIPYNVGPESRLGPIVNDTYFGKVPASRLVAKDGVLFFSGDGKYRSKIGLTPQRARSVLGSYDAANKVLTIVQYNKPQGVSDYVNSMWELQDEPYRGDTINSYNDGPAEPGAKPLGPFYELETSSPAANLAPGQSLLHTHRTFHLVGDEADLDPIARALLGVKIAEITSALP